jgi:hypothetical protein
LAEEAFDLCRSDIVESIDNVGLLLLDLVWCGLEKLVAKAG